MENPRTDAKELETFCQTNLTSCFEQEASLIDCEHVVGTIYLDFNKALVNYSMTC